MIKILKVVQVLFLLFFLNQHLFGQNKIDTSYFIIYSDSDTSISLGYTNTFCVYRQYTEKNVFKEINLFGSNFFCVKKDVWYIKKNGKWQLFFSPKSFKVHTLFFSNYNFMLVPWEKYYENGEQLYKYYLAIKDDINDINRNEYVVFSPAKGFVKIVNNSVVLIRVNKRPKIYVECK